LLISPLFPYTSLFRSCPPPRLIRFVHAHLFWHPYSECRRRVLHGEFVRPSAHPRFFLVCFGWFECLFESYAPGCCFGGRFKKALDRKSTRLNSSHRTI